jgi:septum formation protein
VTFRTLADDEIQRYWRSGEPADKAGAYAVQGLASRFVTRIEGSYSNVVGLPIALVYQMLTTRLLTF